MSGRLVIDLSNSLEAFNFPLWIKFPAGECIFEFRNGNQVKECVPEKEEYYPITFFASSEPIPIGWDLSSVPAAATAMRLAVETDDLRDFGSAPVDQPSVLDDLLAGQRAAWTFYDFYPGTRTSP